MKKKIKNKSKDVTVSFRTSKEIKQAIEIHCKLMNIKPSIFIEEAIKKFVLNQKPIKVWDIVEQINADKVGVPGYDFVKSYNTLDAMNRDIFSDFGNEDELVAKYRRTVVTGEPVLIKIYRKHGSPIGQKLFTPAPERLNDGKQKTTDSVYSKQDDSLTQMAKDVSEMSEKTRKWHTEEVPNGKRDDSFTKIAKDVNEMSEQNEKEFEMTMKYLNIPKAEWEKYRQGLMEDGRQAEEPKGEQSPETPEQ